MAWYVVATKPRQEQLAEQNLSQQGYCALLPKITLKKRKKGKWQDVTEPLFPGYLFIELSLGQDDAAPIRSTVGCRGLVRFGQEQQPVHENIMAPLLAMGDEPITAQAGFNQGDWVQLESGPFEGLTAVFSMPKGDSRAEVLLNILGKPQRLVVDINELSDSDTPPIN